ncbi:ATP-binding cassette domain-containing protein [Microbacterium sp. NPDC077644]|uniref:ABC transporter ATP-binding protein n=1 Tax=Microbacterium sp. NPDC077644 TaxID=3155055 RepID=UPI00344FD0CB
MTEDRWRSAPPHATAPSSATPLHAEAISLDRGGRLIIDGIDCTVEAGSFTALIGPNGAGKSTLLHLIAGVDPFTSGAIALGGTDARALRRRDRARFTALVEQQADTDLELDVLDVVLLGRTPHLPLLGGPGAHDVKIAETALQRAGAHAYVDRRFQELSGGERQRVLLARALAQEPALLLMDEPMNHLDIQAQLHTLVLMRSLADSGIAVLAALHDLTLAARHADQVIVLDHGRVVASGPPAETLTPELIELVYGVRADVIPHPVDGTPLIAFSPLEPVTAPYPLRAQVGSAG